jgi:cytochrome c oxidase assembly protein subunit 15
VLILTLTAVTWLARRQARLQPKPVAMSAGASAADVLQPWWPTLTLVWVCLQGAFGALTVTMKLFPAIVTLHLLGGMVLLALLRAQSARFAVAAGDVRVVTVPRSTWWLLLIGFALLWLQIALGGWVSTNYAVLACTEFPSCQGSFWPAMDFRLGFTLWRELGAGHGDANFTFQALTAVHYVHRLTAYLVFAVLLLLARQLYRAPGMRMHAHWIVALVLWPLVTGVSNVVLGWPLIAAVSHTGGAAALMVVMTGALFSSRRAARPVLREN